MLAGVVLSEFATTTCANVRSHHTARIANICDLAPRHLVAETHAMEMAPACSIAVCASRLTLVIFVRLPSFSLVLETAVAWEIALWAVAFALLEALGLIVQDKINVSVVVARVFASTVVALAPLAGRAHSVMSPLREVQLLPTCSSEKRPILRFLFQVSSASRNVIPLVD